MKKGFTMIELIFVIVILGILASVAIPRLAGTRADAEISSAIANLRTLQSDISSYYAVQDKFSDDLAKMTNVKLEYTGMGGMGSLKVGNDEFCIQLTVVEREDDNPARITFLTNDATTDAICKAVLAAPAVQEYSKHKIYAACNPGAQGDPDGTCVNGQKYIGDGIAIGASAKIY